MKSQTFFFNKTVLRKDITRFSPLWLIYILFLVLAVTNLATSGGPMLTAFRLNELLPFMSYVNAIYAGVTVMMLFSDLYVPRMCYAMHAMPLRREGWFLTHCTAGLLFSVVPNFLAFLVLSPILGYYWYMAWIAFGVCLMQYLFFFGLASVCAMIVGNRFAMLLFYVIFNSFSMIFMWISRIFYPSILYGIQLREVSFRVFCPALQMASDQYMNLKYVPGTEQAVFHGLSDGTWQYLLICGILGIGLTLLALVMYRRRCLETAGDFISVRPMAPVFLAIYTLTITAILYAIASMFLHEHTYLVIIAGVLIGFFTGKMMLSKTVKVFRFKVFLGFLAMLSVFGITLGLLWLDPVGLVNFVPKVKNVQSITISTSNMIYYEEFQEEADRLIITEKADIQSIIDVHKLLLEQQEQDLESTDFTLFMEYKMADGSKVRRSYPICLKSQEGQLLRRYFSSWQCVFKTNRWDNFCASVTGITTTGGTQIPPEQFQTLLNAMYQDCEEGNMAQTWSLYQFAPAQEQLSITYLSGSIQKTLVLRIYSFCDHTMQALTSMQP